MVTLSCMLRLADRLLAALDHDTRLPWRHTRFNGHSLVKYYGVESNLAARANKLGRVPMPEWLSFVMERMPQVQANMFGSPRAWMWARPEACCFARRSACQCCASSSQMSAMPSTTGVRLGTALHRMWTTGSFPGTGSLSPHIPHTPPGKGPSCSLMCSIIEERLVSQ